MNCTFLLLWEQDEEQMLLFSASRKGFYLVQLEKGITV